MKIKFLILFIFIIFLSLTSCRGNRTIPTVSDITSQSYPIQEEEMGYPVYEQNDNAESGYPILEQEQTNYTQGPEFDIIDPVKDGDLVVIGTGPKGVPIKLVDVSEIGLLLAETVIGEDGTFTFKLDSPMELQHIVGLQLGDLTGTNLNENDFIYSDTYYERPLIGILFDMVVVE
ncbi:MAG: hypothetical protein ACTSR2_13020 [Candidatus Hodarchaeales archaeon]